METIVSAKKNEIVIRGKLAKQLEEICPEGMGVEAFTEQFIKNAIEHRNLVVEILAA
ncbi:hypothetical protein [Pontiella desulfatans]|uniref:hypothetical protein n=1 Tax=Pontiella desulfatans TaxID=2750659 RepID=UPI00144441C4|nr:hypothetical protein [Pontiella desulfatans]